METTPDLPPKKRRWRFWTVVVLNVLGVLLILPLLKVAWPLVGIWWHTRSHASLASAQNPSRQAASTNRENPNAPLQELTNQLGLVEQLSDGDIRQIVARNFGATSHVAAATDQFDLASAAFESVSKTNITYQGKTYYGYRVELIDQNGLHQTNIDCFTEPNLDYERSVATMELINRSPQLKRIYQAMASSLAEKAGATPSDSAASNGPALRLDPASFPGQP